jgi:selenocysteine lyase/cysteine desulfurase
MLADYLSRIEGLELFESGSGARQAGVLSVRPGGLDCEMLAEALARRGAAVRAGLHCAPLAHESAGTLKTGTVRFSFSPMNTAAEVRRAAQITAEILRKQ